MSRKLRGPRNQVPPVRKTVRPASSPAPSGPMPASGRQHAGKSIPNSAVGGNQPNGQGGVGSGRFHSERAPRPRGPGRDVTPTANGNQPISTKDVPGVPADAVYRKDRSGKTSSKPAPDVYPV